MSERERLPDTRTSIVHKFIVAGHKGYLIVGFYPDGRPGELFIKMAKEGSTMAGLFDAIGILTSVGLQHGVPLSSLRKKFEGTQFEPMGETHDETIVSATSLVDYIYRWIDHFCSDTIVAKAKKGNGDPQ